MFDMNKYYWNSESFGADYPPVNADEVISAANAALDAWAEANPDAAECDADDYAEGLWRDFCDTMVVNGVRANVAKEEA